MTITSIENDNGDKMAFATPGESLKLMVNGKDIEHIARGDVICGSQFWINVCTDFIAEVKFLQLPKNVLVS